MTPDETQELYKQADKLSGDEQYAFLKEHNLDVLAYGTYVRSKLIGKEHRSSKRVRTKILSQQDGLCGLCKAPILFGDRCCKDKTGIVVCSPCNQYITAWRRARDVGITEEMTVEFNSNF